MHLFRGNSGWHILYLDRSNSKAQNEGLPGLLEELGFDHFRAVRPAPIRFQASENDLSYTVSIAGILEMSSTKIVDESLGTEANDFPI